MKFKVTMKDPDTLHDAIREALKIELKNIAGLDADDRKHLEESRMEKVHDICRTWFEFAEYLTVEIDTDARTAVVVPVKS